MLMFIVIWLISVCVFVESFMVNFVKVIIGNCICVGEDGNSSGIVEL